MSYTERMLAPIYAALGVAAEMTLDGASTIYELVAIDKTGGVEVTLQGAETTTIRPAVAMRMADLIELDLTPADLRDALIAINGASWRVISYYPKPSPMGERDGELYLILTEGEAPA